MKSRINKYIKKLLEHEKRSQSQLAEYLGISRQLLSFKLNRDSWETKELARVAKFFDMTLAEIVSNSGQK